MYLIEIIYFLWNRTRTDQPNTKRMRWRNEGREGKRKEETARLFHAKQRMSLMGKFSVTVSPVWNITTTLTSNSSFHELPTHCQQGRNKNEGNLKPRARNKNKGNLKPRARQWNVPTLKLSVTSVGHVKRRGKIMKMGISRSRHTSPSPICAMSNWFSLGGDGVKRKGSGPLGGDDVEKSSQSYLNVLNFRC